MPALSISDPATVTVSTYSTATLPGIADAAPDGPRWFQLYVARDRGFTRDLVAQAIEHGAAGRFGGADEVGARRVGDGVGDHHSGAKGAPVDVELVVNVREQADGGREQDAEVGARRCDCGVTVTRAGRAWRWRR